MPQDHIDGGLLTEPVPVQDGAPLPLPRIRVAPELEDTLRQLYIRLMVEPVPARLLAVLHPRLDGKA